MLDPQGKVIPRRTSFSHLTIYPITFLHPVWQTVSENGALKAKCIICNDITPRLLKNCGKHERTDTHIALLQQRRPASSNTPEPSLSQPNPTSKDDNDHLVLAEAGLKNLLHSLAGDPLVPPNDFVPGPDPAENFPFPDFFNLADSSRPKATLKQSPREEGAALIARALLERLAELDAVNSDDEGDQAEEDVQKSDSESGSEEEGQGIHGVFSSSNLVPGVLTTL